MGEQRLPNGSSGPNRQPDDVQQTRPRPPLATVLAEAGVASEQQLRLAVAEGMGTGERLGEVLLRRGWIDEDGLARLLARQWRLPFCADEDARLDPQAGRLMPAEQARALAVCPIEPGPQLALAEPTEERLALASGLAGEREFVIVPPRTLERLLSELEQAEQEAASAPAGEPAEQDSETEQAELLVTAIDEAIAGLVALRERVLELSDWRERADAELERCRELLERLEDELTHERDEAERAERELAQQHELLRALKARLADAQAQLDTR